MATGPVIVSTNTGQQQIDLDGGPSTSSMDSNYLPDASDQSLNERRNSMVFRSNRHSSSSDEDDFGDFSADLHDVRKRRYSMDLHRTRQSVTKRGSFALSCSDNSPFSKFQRSHTEDNAAYVKEDQQFATPLSRKGSRPSSPSLLRPIAVASRKRLATIRRESDCSLENLISSEFAHEKLVKNAQRVSSGFEDFSLDDCNKEERKRAKSLAEPISVFTNAFLPQSSSPSPKGVVDTQKQCYSPSTNQIIRSNVPYSTPSPTPSSPARTRIMRSMSPISVRQISKRRFTANGSGSGMESDSENSTSQLSTAVKRPCLIPQRSAASPLVRDSISVQSNTDGQLDVPESYRSMSPSSVCSNSSSIYNNFSRPRIATDLVSIQSDAQSSFIDDKDSISGELPDPTFLNNTNETSTAFSSRFSSRAPTPTATDEQMIEENEACSSNVVTSQNSPMRTYSSGFGIFGRDSSLPPPSPLASKSMSMGDCN